MSPRTMLASVVLFGAVLTSSVALAFRTTRDLPEAALVTNAVRWASNAPTVYVNERGSADLATPDLLSAAQSAFAAWSAPSCADLHPIVAGTTALDTVADDGAAVIAWREAGWSELGYSPAQIAVTRMEYVHDSATEWSLGGADIAMNGENYTWVIEGGMAGSATVDVQTLLTHEAGHFLGLAHPCEVGGANAAPSCGMLYPTTAPTMTPGYFGQAGRTLESDDIEGICFLYPSTSAADAGVPDTDGGIAGDAAIGSDAGTTPASEAGCSVSRFNHSGSGHISYIVMAALGVWVGRRRPRHAIR